MVEKGVVCDFGVRRDGTRKVGGICVVLLDLRRCLTAGRIDVDVDIVGGSSQWRWVSHLSTQIVDLQNISSSNPSEPVTVLSSTASDRPRCAPQSGTTSPIFHLIFVTQTSRLSRKFSDLCCRS